MSNFSDIFRAIFLCFLGDKIEKQKWDQILQINYGWLVLKYYKQLKGNEVIDIH